MAVLHLLVKNLGIVCCMIESIVQVFLSLLDNSLANPECVFFSLTFDGGFYSNAIIGDVPEIELLICDLMSVIINPDADSSM